MANPFDLKTALLAKHAQHVVLIHFPIALFITAVLFDFIAQWTRRRGLADAAYYNLSIRSDFDYPGRRHGYPRLAVPAGGAKTEGHPAAAPGACGRFERADLAGLVVTFPRKADGRNLTKLPPLD